MRQCGRHPTPPRRATPKAVDTKQVHALTDALCVPPVEGCRAPDSRLLPPPPPHLSRGSTDCVRLSAAWSPARRRCQRTDAPVAAVPQRGDWQLPAVRTGCGGRQTLGLGPACGHAIAADRRAVGRRAADRWGALGSQLWAQCRYPVEGGGLG